MDPSFRFTYELCKGFWIRKRSENRRENYIWGWISYLLSCLDSKKTSKSSFWLFTLRSAIIKRLVDIDSTTKTSTYLGPGIRTREEYENNGDVICTSFDVKVLTKASRYNTVLLGMSIFADIRPGCVNETICANKSSEDYIGTFKIKTAIKMKEEMPPAPPNASIDWMPCPSSEPWLD